MCNKINHAVCFYCVKFSSYHYTTLYNIILILVKKKKKPASCLKFFFIWIVFYYWWWKWIFLFYSWKIRAEGQIPLRLIRITFICTFESNLIGIENVREIYFGTLRPANPQTHYGIIMLFESRIWIVWRHKR